MTWRAAIGILVVLASAMPAMLHAQGNTPANTPANAPANPNLQPPPPFTGRNLLTICEAPEQRTADRQGCLRFLQGAATMYEIVAFERGKELTWFCLPREGDPGHYRRLYIEWAKENQSQLDQAAVLAVKAAFADTFSCQE